MHTQPLPPSTVMIEAFLGRDPTYEGVFVTGVRTTGIFCRTTCPARKPDPENLDFFSSARDAMDAGYRPCLRCRPLDDVGRPPRWLRPLLEAVEAEPERRWTDDELRERGLSPHRVRRWFKRHRGMTFHAWSRGRRLGSALDRVQEGERVGRVAFDSGYDSLSGFQDAFQRHFGASPKTVAGRRLARVFHVPTPLGVLVAATTETRVCLLEFADRPDLTDQVDRVGRILGLAYAPGSTELGETLREQLIEYFDGERRGFTVPLAFAGTEFQTLVWGALGEIPWGQTRSYADIARAVGRPSAVRAVGAANGANPLAIVVPCHRVVRSDGALSGYGGGVWRKRRLLELEGSAV